MQASVLLIWTLALPAQAPLVEPAPPPPQQQAPDAKDPQQPQQQQPQEQPQGTGIPFLDRLLQVPAQEPSQTLPTLKEGDPRPVIGYQFDYQDFLNATYFREETLRGFVRHPVGVPLDEKRIQRDAGFIEQQYRLRGFLKAKVTWSKEETAQGDIITFHISAGSRAQLRKVEIEGNTTVPDEALLEGLFHRPLNILSFTDRAGVYHAGYVDQDTRQILKNYEQYGYFEARVNGVKATVVDGDSNTVRIVFYTNPGPLYRIGMLLLSGELPLDVKDSLSVMQLAPGQPAELKRINDGVERLLDLWRNAGYANAKANIETRPREDADELDVIVRVEKGPRTRVGKIRIAGAPNPQLGALQGLPLIGGGLTTSDRVIKRDLAVREGQVYSLAALRRSEERLMYTGLFQKVTLKAVPTDDPAVVDIEVEIVESQTWYFSLAPAYIPGEGLVGLGFIGFRNLFGQAWRLNAAGVLSARRQTGQIDIEDPRIFNTRLSTGLAGRWNRYVYPEFDLLRRGGSLSVGYPIVERSQLSLGYSLERLDFSTPGPLAGYLGTPLFPTGSRRGTVRFDASYDLRNNVLFPTRGLLLAASLEYGSPLFLGEFEFMTLSGNARFYLPMPFGFVVKTNTIAGWVFNPGGGPVSASERFYEGGGFLSIRGFSYQSISPTVPLGNPSDPAGPRLAARIGGVTRFVNNLELETPPIAVTPMTPVKLFVFFDAGNTWSELEGPFFIRRVQGPATIPTLITSERDGIQLPLGLFYSVGVGGMLTTALFPIRLEFSIPITRRNRDEPINFFVTAGSPF